MNVSSTYLYGHNTYLKLTRCHVSTIPYGPKMRYSKSVRLNDVIEQWLFYFKVHSLRALSDKIYEMFYNMYQVSTTLCSCQHIRHIACASVHIVWRLSHIRSSNTVHRACGSFRSIMKTVPSIRTAVNW